MGIVKNLLKKVDLSPTCSPDMREWRQRFVLGAGDTLMVPLRSARPAAARCHPHRPRRPLPRHRPPSQHRFGRQSNSGGYQVAEPPPAL